MSKAGEDKSMLLQKVLFARDDDPPLSGPAFYLGFDFEKCDFVIICVTGRGLELRERAMSVPEFVKGSSETSRKAFFETVDGLLKQ